MRASYVIVIGALSLIAAATSASAGLPTIVYSNDFEGGALGAEWSTPGGCADAGCIAAVTTGCTSVRFCLDDGGGPNNFLGRAPAQTITLTLTDLPPHDLIALDFDLFAINTWDGNDHSDTFTLSVAGGPTLMGPVTFGHSGRPASFPDQPPTNNGHCAGAYECATLGACCDSLDGGGVFTFPWDRYDATGAEHPHVFSFAHTDSTITFEFTIGTSQTCTDECLGLDNVEVSVQETSVPVPELGSLVLFAAALVGMAAVVVVRRRS